MNTENPLHQYSETEKKIDAFITKSNFSVPVFLLLIFWIFELTFTLGNFFAGYLDILFQSLYSLTGLDGKFINAVYGGVTGIFVYLPNIIILYFFLYFLQDSGVLSRISYVFDRGLKKIWLTGNSFLSLFLGFGCTIPAVLATKTIEHRSERILAIMMLPFVTCSAKLPVLVLFVSVFIPSGYQGLFLILLYIISICFGIVSNSFLSYMIGHQRQQIQVFLPRYYMPKFSKILCQIFSLLKEFIVKIGIFILPFSLLLTLAFSYPDDVKIEETYGGQIGKSISVVFEPLGFNEEMSISVVSGLIGKEIVVSTLGSLYYLQDDDTQGLAEKIAKDESITLLSTISFLLFTLLYTPCVWAIVTVRRELGNLWAFIFFLYPILFAWIVSFAVFQIFS